MNYPVGFSYWETKKPGRGWWGPPKGTHGTDRGREAAVKATVKKLATEIVDAKIEHHYTIDSEGNVITSIKGKRTYVDILGEDIDKLSGNTILHNHPGVGPSFSMGDIEIACENNVKESYVVSSGLGKRYLYRFAPGSGIRNRPTLSAELRKINNNTFREMSKDFFSGRISSEKFAHELKHNIWTRANQFYTKRGLNFGYSREEF